MIEKRDVSEQYRLFRQVVNAKLEDDKIKYQRDYIPDCTQDQSMDTTDGYQLHTPSDDIPSLDFLRQNSQPVNQDLEGPLSDDKGKNLL